MRILVLSEPLKTNKRDDREAEVPGKISFMLLKDEELVFRARDGDPWASRELVHRYQHQAYAIAYQTCLGDKEEAEDLTQEAFLKVFRNLKKFKGKSTFYTWFYRIVLNTCIDGLRRRRRRERIFSRWGKGENRAGSSREVIQDPPEMQEASDPMEVLREKQLTERLREALQSLSEKQRVIFQLKVVSGMRISEIAQVMKMAEGTVKSHLFRATHLLREELKDWAGP